MRLSLKTKFTLATSILVLAVVAVVSGLYLGRLTRQVLRQADDRARFVAQQVFLACRNALAEAAERGDSPASTSPKDVREYVRRSLDSSSTLNSLVESAVGYSPTIYEISISDRDGIVLVSSDAALRGEKIANRPPVSSLVHSGFFQQLRTLYGPPQVYEYSLAFNLGSGPFGDIRIGLSSALIRDEIWRCLELLRAAGQSILVIDKNVDALTRIADRHYIIERGRVVWTGDSRDLANAGDVQQRYLGV